MAFEYAKTVGLVSDKIYPYKGKNQQCQTSLINNNTYKITDYKTCGYGSLCNDDTWYSMLKSGPFVVHMDASSPKMQLYLFGLLDLTDCKSPNHAIVSNGWDSTWVFNTEYIHLRNSWGKTWGELRIFRVAYKPNSNKTCFITSTGILPLI